MRSKPPCAEIVRARMLGRYIATPASVIPKARFYMTAIKVPPLGESIVEATISRWLKNEGDAVSPGETLVELETDKITVDVPSMSSGVLKKRLKAEGDVVKVDEVLAEIEEGAQAAAPAAAAPKAASAEPAAA